MEWLSSNSDIMLRIEDDINHSVYTLIRKSKELDTAIHKFENNPRIRNRTIDNLLDWTDWASVPHVEDDPGMTPIVEQIYNSIIGNLVVSTHSPDRVAVSNIFAEKGFGPILYLIGMFFADAREYGLVAGSPRLKAKNVWMKFYNNVQIQKIPFPYTIFHDDEDAYLNNGFKIYSPLLREEIRTEIEIATTRYTNYALPDIIDRNLRGVARSKFNLIYHSK